MPYALDWRAAAPENSEVKYPKGSLLPIRRPALQAGVVLPQKTVEHRLLWAYAHGMGGEVRSPVDLARQPKRLPG
jgi:hypothetical protein